MIATLRAVRNLTRLIQIGIILARHDALFLLDRATMLLPLLAFVLLASAQAAWEGWLTEAQVQDILGEVDGISFVRFGHQDVVRHQLVQRIVEAYREHTEETGSERKH